MDNSEDKWRKLEQIVRQAVADELDKFFFRHKALLQEELAKQAELFGKKPKVGLVNGKWVGITQEQMEAWRAAYGSVDIDAELKRALAWMTSNPHLAPASQYARFLNTWLSRTHNQASLRSIPTKHDLPKKVCAYCGNPPTGSVSGISHCSAHLRDAMDGVPVKAA